MTRGVTSEGLSPVSDITVEVTITLFLFGCTTSELSEQKLEPRPASCPVLHCNRLLLHQLQDSHRHKTKPTRDSDMIYSGQRPHPEVIVM